MRGREENLDALDEKIVEHFPGRSVCKGLTAQLKRGANVPTYVLEFLLGMYCASDDPEIVEAGMERIREILRKNYVRPDESEVIKSRIREDGEYTIIDRVEGYLDEYRDLYMARFTNLEIDPVLLESKYAKQYKKLLAGGIWCLVTLGYEYGAGLSEHTAHRRNDPRKSPFRIRELQPIQMPSMDLQEIVSERKNFTFEQWRDLLLRSAGYEPDTLNDKEKMHFIERMVPLAERNYNFCELGPRGTGKSHIYKEISPYSILMSGGKTTTANLFYNMRTREVGLVGHWDCVAFDEVAGMHFSNTDTIQILKDYMASGSFARGPISISADASIVYVGNINDSVDVLLKVSHLFTPFPQEFNCDSAFFDRIHYYLPGWETPKMRSDLLTEKYGWITDCLAEYCKEMRRIDFSDAFDAYFKLNREFNKRDEIAVRKTFSGLCKLLFPDGRIEKEEAELLLRYAIEGRRRVKEQLRTMAGVEFIDVKLGYVDAQTGEEKIVPVPEKNEDSLVTEDRLPFGHVFAVGRNTSGDMGVYRLENKTIRGSGRLETQGIGNNRAVRESVAAAWTFFQENLQRLLPGRTAADRDFLLFYGDAQGKGQSAEISVGELIGLCSALVERPVLPALAVAGDLKLSGSLSELSNLNDILRVCRSAGARRVLLPIDAIRGLQNTPRELLENVQPLFYNDALDAVRKALDIY